MKQASNGYNNWKPNPATRALPMPYQTRLWRDWFESDGAKARLIGEEIRSRFPNAD